MTTVVLSTGGTGGHLFPAQALAQELARRGKKIVVMTDARGTTYQTQFPGAAIEIVPAAAFADRSKLRLMTAPFEILAGILVSLAKLARIKPGAVVGFGGYPSVPVMLAAIIARLPTAILAPDAVLGRANRLVANSVKVIAGGLPLVRFLPNDPSKIVYTGNPLRPEVLAQAGAP
ncbi:MAG TPA: glycosyltransferase, partial [Rhizomicrobium sp.]